MARLFRFLKFLFLFLIILAFVFFVLSRGKTYPLSELSYGLTFSKKQAEALGLPWRKVFVSLLDDLGAKKIRLAAYWDEVEPNGGEFFWEDLDWQIEEAGARGGEIILAVGGRLPRWPECHFPSWAEEMPAGAREKKALAYIEKVISRYKEEKSIYAWQIENEPFLSHFGDCPRLDKNFLDKEIALARSLDSRPIIITDSGELSFWVSAARRADIFGTTMYRDTYSSFLESYVHYPINPSFFKLKKNLAGIFARPDEWIVIELQAEPWASVHFKDVSPKDRARTMDFQKFKEIIEFARLAGFQKFYLWGAEYWYWEKEVNGDNRIWEEARRLFGVSGGER